MSRFDRSSLLNRVKKNLEDNAQRGTGTKYILPEGTEFAKIAKGTRHYDVIPFVVTRKNNAGSPVGDIDWRRLIYVHYGIGPEDKSYICPKTIGKPCPICQHLSTLAKSENEDDVELAKRMRAKEREVMNVVDLDEEDGKIRLFEMSRHLFGTILDEELNNVDDDFKTFMFPESGYTLKVRFTDKKLGKFTFPEATRIDFIDRKKQYKDSIVDKALDLDAILNILPYEKLEAIFLGVADDAEAPAPAPAKAQPEPEEAPRKRRGPDDDETPAPRRATREAPPEEVSKKDVPWDDAEEPAPHPHRAAAKPVNPCKYDHRYGYDCEKFDECETCQEWDGCSVKRDELVAAGEIRSRRRPQ